MVNEIIIAVLLILVFTGIRSGTKHFKGQEDAMAVLRKSGQKKKIEKYHRSEEGTDRRHDL